MNKICILYTGGTIGMIADANGILQPPQNPQDFLNIAPEIHQIADIDFFPIMNKDSTNINHYDWQIMARTIYNKRDDGYTGFVIIHGTDTLHFSASALAFIFGSRLNFPIVLTGSQCIASVIHGDAKINLIRAVQVALTDLAEVVICFGDQVFRGCRTHKIEDKSFNAFASPACLPVATIEADIVIHPHAICRNHTKTGELQLNDQFAQHILQISLIPSLTPELLMPMIDQQQCEAIILQAFGAGNLPDQQDQTGDYRFYRLIEKATQAQIPVIMTSQFSANSTTNTNYQTAVKAIDAGAITTGNMTAAAASTKTRWVLGQVQMEILTHQIDSADKLKRVNEMMQTIYIKEMD